MANKKIDVNQFEEYLKIYRENPDSRVFAPLSDIYRKLGRLVEAESICRDGIERHPYYAGGKVALAHVLFDLQNYQEAIEQSEAVVAYYADNVLARKILIFSLNKSGDHIRAKKEYELLKEISPNALAGSFAKDLEFGLESSKTSTNFNPVDRSKKLKKLLKEKIFLQSLMTSFN